MLQFIYKIDKLKNKIHIIINIRQNPKVSRLILLYNKCKDRNITTY